MDWAVFSVVVAIVGVGAALAVLGYSMKGDNRDFLQGMQEENRKAHERIEGNIGRVEVDLKASITKVEGKIDTGFAGINNDLKGFNRAIGRLEGRNRTTDDGASV